MIDIIIFGLVVSTLGTLTFKFLHEKGKTDRTKLSEVGETQREKLRSERDVMVEKEKTEQQSQLRIKTIENSMKSLEKRAIMREPTKTTLPKLPPRDGNRGSRI